jgi:hypothetical protein
MGALPRSNPQIDGLTGESWRCNWRGPNEAHNESLFRGTILVVPNCETVRG